MTLISNFEVPRQDSRGIVKTDLEFLKMDFMMPNPKFAIEIMVLGCEISNFLILGSIYRFFSKISHDSH